MNDKIASTIAAVPRQRMSQLLSTVATTAKVTGTSLGLGRADKDAAKSADRQHNARVGASRVVVSRLAGFEDRVKEMRDMIEEGRELLISYTTAWGDRRLLPNTNIEPFLRDWMELKTRFDKAQREFIADAPGMIAAARDNIGSFKVQPPSLEDVEKAFSLDFAMEPIPDSASFKSTTLETRIEEELRRQFEARIEAAYQQAQEDALRRLAEPLRHVVARLTEYDEAQARKATGEKVTVRLYDSMMEHVQEISKVFATFNLTDDPAMKKLAEQLDAFENVSTDDLKNYPKVREDTAKRAQAILDQLGDWIR